MYLGLTRSHRDGDDLPAVFVREGERDDVRPLGQQVLALAGPDGGDVLLVSQHQRAGHDCRLGTGSGEITPAVKNSQIVIKVLFLISFYWLNLLPPPSMSTRQTITQAWSRKENRLVKVDF